MLDRLVLKENEIFAVTDREGNIRAQSADGQGLYFRDTRFLSVFELNVDDIPLQLLSSAGELNFTNSIQFGNIPCVLPGGTELQARTLSVRRIRFIDNGLHERIGFMNYGSEPLDLSVRLTFGSDFRDMFDVRGYARRVRRGRLGEPDYTGGVVRLRYTGLDQVDRTTEVRFDVKPDNVKFRKGDFDPRQGAFGELPSGAPIDPRMEPNVQPPLAEAMFRVPLEPGGRWAVTLDVDPIVESERSPTLIFPSLDESFARALDSYNQWDASCTSITTDHELVNSLIQQSQHDLRLTINRVATGLMPVAGIPWFAVPFGRDSLITALQTLCLNPEIAYGTLRFLARLQGQQVDPWRDEEPGKILHEMRSGEMAALHEVPQTPYYGSIDSTPLFIVLFGELMRWTDDWTLAADLRPHLEQALRWIVEYGDLDGDGLVEYQSRSSGGIRNQGWKDSFDSVSFPDRSLAQPAIAIAEVQGYCYAAERTMAGVYRRWGERELAESLERSAADRKRRFDDQFWLEDEQFYAEALDGEKRPVPAVTTNPGHCLLMGMLDGPRAQATVDRLMADDMLSGWGLRTLSSDYPTFNPMSYHNGSIWPHDNSIVAAGLRRCGFGREALRVIEQLLDAGFRLPDFRIPELYCGFSRDRQYQSAPAQYPVSCSPQSWAAGAVFLMLQHLIGLEPDLSQRRLDVSPALLPWVNELCFDRLHLGENEVSIRVWRRHLHVECEVQGAQGLDVHIHPALE